MQQGILEFFNFRSWCLNFLLASKVLKYLYNNEIGRLDSFIRVNKPNPQ